MAIHVKVIKESLNKIKRVQRRFNYLFEYNKANFFDD